MGRGEGHGNKELKGSLSVHLQAVEPGRTLEGGQQQARGVALGTLEKIPSRFGASVYSCVNGVDELDPSLDQSQT